MPEQPEGIEWTRVGGVGQTLRLDDGTISGSGGCNRYFGRYALDSGRLSVEPLGSTRMACAPEVMRAEADFLAALTRVAGAVVEGGELVLADDAGVEILRFAADRRAADS